MRKLASTRSSLRIPYQKFQLKNGLQVILHQDLRLPRVVVNVLYRIGSKDDPRHRSGMAHLFEHLMFMGTKRVPEKHFDLLMEQMGGANNAFTSEDVTDYYDMGPSSLLETLLWVEADRMSSMTKALTKQKLDLQREVVLNELRQSYENAPYGLAYLNLPALAYPKNHPYSWPVIGSSEDLRSVTVSDVKDLFLKYYSPRNASLVIAGHFDLAEVKEMVHRYFAWIPAKETVRLVKAKPAQFKKEIRQQFVDQVELTKLFFLWHSPAHFTAGDAEMDLAASILTTGKESRLYRALVHDKQLALDIEAHQESRWLGSQFLVEISIRDGVQLDEVMRATQQVLDDFVAQAPSAKELERAQNLYEAQFMARLERLQRRAELLNLYFAYTGEPDYLDQDLMRYRKVSPAGVQRWSKKILHPHQRLVVSVTPNQPMATAQM